MDGFDGRFDHGNRVHGPTLEVELAGHDARHVEEILDQLRKQLGVAFDHLDAARRARRVRGSSTQESRPPEHGGQRRAQLMRHDREKLVLGSVRLAQLAARFLKIAQYALVLPHVAQDTDRADDRPVDVREGRSVERRGNDLARGAARIQPDVARNPPLDDLAQGSDELAGLLGRDDSRQRLFDDLIGTESQQCEHGVVGLEDLASQVADEDRVRSVFDQVLSIRSRLVELPHVTEDPDDADGLTSRIPQRGGVQGSRNHFARGAAGVQSDISRDAALHDLSHCSDELLGLLRIKEAREGLFEDLIAAKPKQMGDRFVRLEDLAAEVGNEHGVRRVCHNDVGGEATVDLATGGGVWPR